jgi:plasmid maintenance system antidote protein VapI
MNIRDMLRERGLKQEWVAQQIGIHPVTFSRIINGKAPLPDDKVRPLANTLHCPMQTIRAACAPEPTP